MMRNYAGFDHTDEYYNIEKSSIVSLIPEGPHVVLDLGCATGRVGRMLREQNKAKAIVGVEIFVPAAEEAAKHYDRVYDGDVELLSLPYKEYFDIVVCGDILEHLRDPWVMVRKIRHWLKKDGTLISSIPNIRYWRILRDLIFKGKWEYAEAGILDRTHLRFFTRTTFLRMLREGNYLITLDKMSVHGKKQNLFNTLTMKMFEEFLGSQLIVIARKI
jgi:2-polyprenyl-3-methyl-5-hydroxy-6-metoxy-1,4-benzoquinol methylase